MTSSHDHSDTTLTTILTQARSRAMGTEMVAVADCVNWLLDCYNAGSSDEVRRVVQQLLPAFSHGSLRPAADFLAALDEIDVAYRIDDVFNDLVIGLGTP